MARYTINMFNRQPASTFGPYSYGFDRHTQDYWLIPAADDDGTGHLVDSAKGKGIAPRSKAEAEYMVTVLNAAAATAALVTAAEAALPLLLRAGTYDEQQAAYQQLRQALQQVRQVGA